MLWPFSPRPVDPAIRRLTQRQAGACAEIHSAFFARPWGAGEIEDLLRQKEVVADAAVDGRGKKVFGFAISRVLCPEAEILTIAVDRRFQGKGIGRALLAAHLARLAAAGAQHVFLEVAEANASAVKLYRSFGFAQVGQRPGYYAMKDGSRATALVFRAELV